MWNFHIGKFEPSNFGRCDASLTLNVVILIQTAKAHGVHQRRERGTTITEEDSISDQKGTEQWEQKVNATQLYITSTIEPQQSRKLMNCKTAKEIWDRLTSQYDIPS